MYSFDAYQTFKKTSKAQGFTYDDVIQVIVKGHKPKVFFFPDVVYQHKKYPIRPISGSGLLLVSSEMSCVRPITQLCRLDTKSARS